MYSVYVLDILFKRVVQAPCAIPDGQHFIYMWTTLPLYHHFTKTGGLSVADPGEGGAPPPLKLEKKIWRKIVIFHTKYPKHFRASLRNWKKYDFLA